MALSTRCIELHEVPGFRALIMSVFGADVGDDPEDNARYVELLPLDRTCGAFDGAQLVATSGTYPLHMSVPGGTLPVAGLTMVTVSPTHRRRGALRAMIDAHLDAATTRGDAVSALWASQTAIYGRFGFGIASELEDVDASAGGRLVIDPRHAGDDIAVAGADLERTIPALYEQLRVHRAGMLARSPAWWAHRHFHDPVDRRGGGSKRRYVVALRDGVARGYLCYRQKPKFDGGLPEGAVAIVELLAEDTRAEASLLHFAANIDLHPKLTWWNAPVDSALAWVAADFRHPVRRRSDALWLRINDVVGALTARTYETDGALCLRVTDPLGRDVRGSYAVRIQGGRAAVERCDAAPDLTLDVGALGSLYLGGLRATHLARVGQIDGAAQALTRADRLFTTERAPWCAEIF